ncbi:M16 family metallopeptidase [Emticicia sp.]|uniref:M16 family metallopeptidase n=1 Tax=Emticicia sp. TaxID=1930953 RepID=UPI0037533C11
MFLDRTIAPPSKKIEHVNIPKAEIILLDNQIAVYSIQAGEQPVSRLELIFDAGSRFEANTGESLFTSKMLAEGTKYRSGTEISQYFDQFGAFLEINQSTERLIITVHGMTKHLPKLLSQLQEMISESVIPEKELLMQKNIASQTLKVNLEKTAYVAGQVFREQIYGATHPYGKSLNQSLIENIDRKSLRGFYEKQIQGKQFKIFLAGKFGENEIQALNQSFGQMALKNIENEGSSTDFTTLKAENILVEKPENLQSSIRLGRKLFNRSHPDFLKFLVTNTIFGGYFGSRLMKNIREDKGFTYGISSSIVPQKEGGYLVMGTDVKKEFTQQTLNEIFKEINILQNELVDENELETAKNYMIGSFVGSLNTPFDVADRQKIILLDNLPADYYQNYIKNIRAVSASEVMEIANKYYNPEDMCEVVVGGK